MNVSQSDSPLNQTNYREINAALAALNQARLKVEQAKRAGVDCDEYSGICDHYEAKLNSLKQEYFAGKP